MKSWKFILVLCCSIASAVLAFSAAASDGYSFTVTNNTKETIKGLRASEDGKEWGAFDIGSEGIAPGKTMQLQWDKSTDEKSCEWYFKAVYGDGDESEAVKFDFCEDDLNLEFS